MEEALAGHAYHFSAIQVPFRRVSLTDGTHFDQYDTTGPQVSVMPAEEVFAIFPR